MRFSNGEDAGDSILIQGSREWNGTVTLSSSDIEVV